MLTPLEKDRLDKFLSYVGRLQLRFPIARIAEKTGFDKGYVSKAMKGERALSDNFLTTFYSEFPVEQIGPDEKESPNKTNEVETNYKTEGFREKYYSQLEATNKALQTQLDIIAKQAEAILSQQQTIHNLSSGNSNGRPAASG